MDDNCVFMFCSMSSETAGEFLGCMLVVEMPEMQPNRSSEESSYNVTKEYTLFNEL